MTEHYNRGTTGFLDYPDDDSGALRNVRAGLTAAAQAGRCQFPGELRIDPDVVLP